MSEHTNAMPERVVRIAVSGIGSINGLCSIDSLASDSRFLGASPPFKTNFVSGVLSPPETVYPIDRSRKVKRKSIEYLWSFGGPSQAISMIEECCFYPLLAPP